MITYGTTFEKMLKGLAMIFAGLENPFIIFRSQENIHLFQNKYQNPHKFANITKKNRVFGKFHSWGHSNSVFNFLKF